MMKILNAKKLVKTTLLLSVIFISLNTLHNTVSAQVDDTIDVVQQVGYLELDSAENIYVSGQIAYTSYDDGDDGGIDIVDVSDPTNPLLIASHATEGYTYFVEESENLIYFAEIDRNSENNTVINNIMVFDTTTPNNPTLASSASYNNHTQVDGVGNMAYIYGHDGLHLYDMSDPANPVQVAEYVDSPTADIEIAGNIAYITNQFDDEGLKVMDISDPVNPILLTTFGTGFPITYSADIYLNGTTAYIHTHGGHGGDLLIIDVSDPINPVLLSTVESFDDMGNLLTMQLIGDFIYATHVYDTSSIMIIDASNPTNPVRFHYHSTQTPSAGAYSAIKAHISEDRLYLYGSYFAEVEVVDIGDPTNPTLLTSTSGLDEVGNVRDIDVVGDYIYVAMTNESGLQIMRQTAVPIRSTIFLPYLAME